MKSRKEGRIAGIVLAAGRSSRMGRPKAFLRENPLGPTFVSRLVGTIRHAGLTKIVVVGRPDDGALRREASIAGAEFVPNPRADDGQLSSVVAGLNQVEEDLLAAILVAPVDVPLVTADTVRRLLSAAGDDSLIVRPVHSGRHGHPVIFRRAVFDELRHADPSQGARAVVRADPTRVLDIEVDDPAILIDFDTPEDLQRRFGHTLESE